MKNLIYIFILIILLKANNVYSQDVSVNDIQTKNFLGSAPNEFRHKINFRPLDTSGGIKLTLSMLEIPEFTVAGLPVNVTPPWTWAPRPYFGMMPGKYEKLMGFKFGDQDPCMYAKGIQYNSTGTTGICAQNKFSDLSYNDNSIESLDTAIAKIFSKDTPSIFSIDAVAQNIGSEDSCEKIYDNFYVAKNTVDNNYKINLDACMYHCKNPDVIDDKYKSICGVNDCNMKYANAPSASNWCKYLAGQLNTSYGNSSPLNGIYQKSQKTEGFFGDCVTKWVNGGTATNECCNQADLMIKYSVKDGTKFTDFCSHKKAQSICYKEYISKKTIHPSCCALAKKYGSATNIPEAKTSLMMKETFGRSVEGFCSGYKKQDYSFYNNCITQYNGGKGRVVESCCKAYALGILIPSRDGINYPTLSKFCKIRN